jgi:uroporphyrinogen III methyltransferase/synthase
VIQSGTLPTQRTVTGLLGDIAERARAAEIKPPAVLVVGEVASLRERLSWWEKRPLYGKVAVITRTREQASALSALLAAAGARCLEIPTLEIAPPDDFGPLDAAIRDLDHYHWLVFTSANGVNAFVQRVFSLGFDLRILGPVRLAAIGPATAEALKRHGLIADLVPDRFVAEDLAQALLRCIEPGSWVLLARAQQARDVLPDMLAQAHMKVQVAPVYRMQLPHGVPPEALPFLETGKVDILTFASSATVHNFATLVGKEKLQELATGAVIAAIGPITAATLQEYGLTPQIQPQDFTIPALAAAIVGFFGKTIF